MDLNIVPDFVGLARTSIEIFHPEILNFPDEIVEKAVEKKAAMFRKHYEDMLLERKNG